MSTTAAVNVRRDARSFERGTRMNVNKPAVRCLKPAAGLHSLSRVPNAKPEYFPPRRLLKGEFGKVYFY